MSVFSFSYLAKTIGSSLAQMFSSAPVTPGVANYGSRQVAPIAIVYGRNRVGVNLFYATPPGGRIWNGGKILVGICEGEIASVLRCWQGMNYYNPFSGWVGWTVFLGSDTQTGWTGIDVAERLNYHGVAYAAHLTLSSQDVSTMSSISLEVGGLLHGSGDDATGDADPEQIIQDLLPNERYGPGVSFTTSTATGTDGNAASSYERWIDAAQLWISPVIDSPREARECLREWLDATFSDARWSAGQLQIVPLADTAVTLAGTTGIPAYNSGTTYADGAEVTSGGTIYVSSQSGNTGHNPASSPSWWAPEGPVTPAITYTPDTTIRAALGLDDFLLEGDDPPIEVKRSPRGEVYNVVPVEYLARIPADTSDPANAYNKASVEGESPTDVVRFGKRLAPSVSLLCICRRDVAKKIATLRARQATLATSTYRFRLPWRHCRLEPLDFVSLTEPLLGLSARRARITKIKRRDDLSFDVEAVGWDLGTGAAVG